MNIDQWYMVVVEQEGNQYRGFLNDTKYKKYNGNTVISSLVQGEKLEIQFDIENL